MNKKLATLLIVLIVVIVGYFLYKNYNFKFESNVGVLGNDQPVCSFKSSTIGIYKYAFSTNQNGMKVYTYSTDGIKGGSGFYFGQKIFSDKSSAEEFYTSFVDKGKEFNLKNSSMLCIGQYGNLSRWSTYVKDTMYRSSSTT